MSREVKDEVLHEQVHNVDNGTELMQVVLREVMEINDDGKETVLRCIAILTLLSGNISKELFDNTLLADANNYIANNYPEYARAVIIFLGFQGDIQGEMANIEKTDDDYEEIDGDTNFTRDLMGKNQGFRNVIDKTGALKAMQDIKTLYVIADNKLLKFMAGILIRTVLWKNHVKVSSIEEAWEEIEKKQEKINKKAAKKANS